MILVRFWIGKACYRLSWLSLRLGGRLLDAATHIAICGVCHKPFAENCEHVRPLIRRGRAGF